MQSAYSEVHGSLPDGLGRHHRPFDLSGEESSLRQAMSADRTFDIKTGPTGLTHGAELCFCLESGIETHAPHIYL